MFIMKCHFFVWLILRLINKQTLTLVRGKVKKNHNTLFEYSWLKDMQTLKVLIARSVKPLSVKLWLQICLLFILFIFLNNYESWFSKFRKTFQFIWILFQKILFLFQLTKTELQSSQNKMCMGKYDNLHSTVLLSRSYLTLFFHFTHSLFHEQAVTPVKKPSSVYLSRSLRAHKLL